MGDAFKPGISLVPRSKYLALIAFVALFLCVAELADVFEIPLGSLAGGSASSGSLFSLGFLNSLLDIGYAGLFVLMTMENSSLPVPSEVVLPLAGYLAFEGKMSLGGAIAVATVAGVFGSLIAYYIGLALGRPIVYSVFRRVGVSPSHLDNGEKWIDSRGAWSVFVARFIPGLRSVISIPAGLLKMRMSEFLPLTAAGSFIWSTALIYAGYSAGPLWQKASGSASALVGQAALVIIAAVSVTYLAYFLGAFSRKR